MWSTILLDEILQRLGRLGDGPLHSGKIPVVCHSHELVSFERPSSRSSQTYTVQIRSELIMRIRDVKGGEKEVISKVIKYESSFSMCN